ADSASAPIRHPDSTLSATHCSFRAAKESVLCRNEGRLRPRSAIGKPAARRWGVEMALSTPHLAPQFQNGCVRKSGAALSPLAHNLFRKPLPTFRDYALGKFRGQ